MEKTNIENNIFLREIKLKKSIEAHGNEINSLEFRELTTRDTINFGEPINYNANGEAVINYKVVAKYISALASIPISSVEKLSIHDFKECKEIILSFFMQ